ncbi:MAG: hypothetical protein EWV75_04585 [Microcystis wesenbergii Mw_QC_S_20081001_S30D]|jgi:hypothetical protein|uniref:Uncharacterized protein n=1 Tax=Microcystis wesenbergii Mw_QC_S_20081001_S30D TaxID=2486245 RepID=A0A552JVC0_9CHRO|nr:MAG: hypothetical protein EWV74_16620 [Microcystis wesenbergii Mw_QC_S_20081001_S30]TRU99668.1 MAG: hypothetical protein EWV75_04585 [Microcystis wesenbergii Mw_QC_S_20081001_S30D]TRV02744.1 MAG: hypothetical protein EWV73_06330 [Microcystis wesenbergii Mw_QC_B_20070930_S4D]TRV18233.1 MAG: hypothetical protein EWV89_00305 [Microcystis wesenbergii Mw_QC_B_20070930_S4]
MLSREAQLFVGWVSDSVTLAGVGFHASTVRLSSRPKPNLRSSRGKTKNKRHTEVLPTSTIDQLASKKAPRSDAMARYRLRQTGRWGMSPSP